MSLLWTVLLSCGGGAPNPVPVAASQPEPQAHAPAWESMQTLVPSDGLEADLAVTQAFFATRPLIEQPLGVGLDKGPFSDWSARTCGACHAEIYAEWKTSTHAHAWVDLQYQAEIQKSGNRWMCVNCHTPLLVQQERWPRDLVDGDVEHPIVTENPRFDASLQQEGITCVACHARGGVIEGPGLADSTPPHPVEVAEDLQSEAICLRCHQATATYPGKQFICVFNTGQEWEASGYKEDGQSCITCHMPEVESAVAAGGPVRKRRQHWWRGAGIPKVEGVQPPVEANPPGLAVRAERAATELRLVLENARAGHTLPSGDPERWIQVDVTFQDAAGTALSEQPAHSVRIGQHWEWHPEPRKLGDTRLQPREVRNETVAWPEAAVSATVVATSHRMSVETAEYHGLVGKYPLSIETHRLTVQ